MSAVILSFTKLSDGVIKRIILREGKKELEKLQRDYMLTKGDFFNNSFSNYFISSCPETVYEYFELGLIEL